MKTKFLRAVALASFSLFATAALVAPASVYAADKSKDETPKISKKFSKPLSEANKAIQAKDWKTAIAKLQEAQAIEDATPYENWVINYYLSVCYISSDNKQAAADAILKAVAIKDVPEKDHQSALNLALQIVSIAEEPAKVVEFVKTYIPADMELSEGTAHNIAYAYYRMNDFESAKQYELKAIATAKAKNATPGRFEYKLLEVAYSKLKDMAGVIATGGELAAYYGTPEDWGQYLDLQTGMLGSKGGKNKNVETAALYIYKLRVHVGADSKDADYMEAAELADAKNLPNDVITVLTKGMQSGAVTSKKAPVLLAKAKRELKRDQATLPAADKASAKSKSASGDISVASDYLSYGKYADAERVANRAIAKGGAYKEVAQLILGVAQTLDNNPAATDTLAQIKTDQALKVAAECWTTYAKGQAYKAATEAAANAAPAPAN